MGKEKAKRKKEEQNNKIIGQTWIPNLADKLDQVKTKPSFTISSCRLSYRGSETVKFKQ